MGQGWTWAAPCAAAEVATMAVLLLLARRGSLRARLVLFCLAAASTAAYLVWRATATLVFASYLGIPSLVLLAAELVGFSQSCLLYLLSARPYRRQRPVWPEDRPLPSVDLFVPTFNEPPAVLRRTLAACSRIDYPAGRLTVWVLDDGGRADVRRLAGAFGLEYIARPDHSHAKAGNMNNAMAQSSGELIAVLDADMVPKSRMLLDMVGYFGEDPRLAFVQAPQAFFNPDPFQHNLGLHRQIPNEQNFFMRDILASRDRVNAVMCIGSNVVFRRSALDAIGGFGTKSITEDVETGMLLHAAGWRSAYHDGEVAVGLSPESMAEMVAQRVRWCRGNIQTARAYHPMTMRGLTLWQRLVYTSGIVYWYFGLQHGVYLLAPILYVLAGVQSVNTTPASLVAFWLPATVGANLAFSALGIRRASSFWSSVFELALAPPLGLAALRETFRRPGQGFHVTLKGLTSQHATIASLCFNHLAVVLAIDLTTVAVAVLRLMSPVSPAVRFGLAVNLLWAAANAVPIAIALLSAVDQPRPRGSERFPVAAAATIHAGDRQAAGCTVDISETGARIACESSCEWLAKDTPCRLTLAGGQLNLEATVISQRDTPAGVELALSFDAVADADFPEMVGLLFDRPDVTAEDGRPIGLVGAVQHIAEWEIRSVERERAARRIGAGRVPARPRIVARQPRA